MRYYFTPHKRVKRSPDTALHSVWAAVAGFLLLLALAAASAYGQVIGTANQLQHVSDYTGMWSLTDPFGFGAVSNLQLSAAAPKPSAVSFDTGYAGSGSLTNGQMSWDPDNRTVSVGLENGVILQLGQELPIPVENRTGSVITNGMVVGFAGTVSASGRILVSPFLADGAVPSHLFLGMVTSDDGSGGIRHNGSGYVTWFGQVRGRDTTGAFDGESWPSGGVPVYVSTNRAGFLTINKPQAPDPVIIVGSVAYRSSAQGVVNIRPRWYGSIRDMDDVDGTVPAASGQILVYDAARRVHDFTHNINSYATTGSLSVVSDAARSASAAASAAQATSAVALASAVTALSNSVSASALASNASDSAASALVSAASAVSTAGSVYGVATNALGTADSAYGAALDAFGFSSAAYSLAVTYRDGVTDAVWRAGSAYGHATNAEALAAAALLQNAYPEAVWSPLGTAEFSSVTGYSQVVVSDNAGSPTASVRKVYAPTNVAWHVWGFPVLTNAVTSYTNLLSARYTQTLPLDFSVMPYPLTPVAGASTLSAARNTTS